MREIVSIDDSPMSLEDLALYEKEHGIFVKKKLTTKTKRSSKKPKSPTPDLVMASPIIDNEPESENYRKETFLSTSTELVQPSPSTTKKKKLPRLKKKKKTLSNFKLNLLF